MALHVKHLLSRRAALCMWKQRLGSSATYQKLIDIFECADYYALAESVRNIILCDIDSEMDDSSDYDEPMPQPATYPHRRLSLLSSISPKFSSCELSTYAEYLLIDQATAKDLPEGENCIKLGY